MRAVHFAFGDSVKNPLRFEKIQDRAGTVPGISLHVNIPDVPGKKKDEKRAQKNPRKKGLSLPVSLEKERHAVFAEDPYAGAAFSGCRLQIKKILQRNVQLIRPCSGTQIPESDPRLPHRFKKRSVPAREGAALHNLSKNTETVPSAASCQDKDIFCIFPVIYISSPV